jgi:hypothetical protein
MYRFERRFKVQVQCMNGSLNFGKEWIMYEQATSTPTACTLN